MSYLTNPYRYAVAFECQEGSGENMGLGGASGTRTKAGVRVKAGNSAIGKTVTEIKFFLKKSGSPSGTVNLAVYNGGVDQSAGGSTIDPATLTTSYVLYTFTMSHTVAENDDIVLEGGTVEDSNQVKLSQNTSNTYADQISVAFETAYGWITSPPYMAERDMYWCYK